MKEISSTLKDLLTDESFIEFVFDKSPLPANHWTRVKSIETPEFNDIIIRAKNIFNNTNEDITSLSETDFSLLKLKIINSLRKSNQ